MSVKLAVLLGGLVVCAQPAVLAGKTLKVTPEQDYTSVLKELKPGDELVLLPGVHRGHAVLRASGTAQKPITIRGVIEEGERPELRFSERGHNLWRIRASHIRLQDLTFHATRAYGIRIGEVADIEIENCVFRDCGGGDLSASSGDVQGLRIRGCRFLRGRRAPVYIGNHQGDLDVRGFVFEGNVIDGSKIEAVGSTIGYGIQLKLNVRGGVIRENFITGTLGPGIMVYGAENAKPGDASLIEKNIVIGSRRNPGIVIGGGPAMARNNLVMECRSGGIQLLNYGGRNLLEGIRVVDNIAVKNGRYGLSIDRPVRDLELLGNRVWTEDEEESFRGIPERGVVRDNRVEPVETSLRGMVDRFRETVPAQNTLSSIWQGRDAFSKAQAELTDQLESLRGQ